MWGRDADGKGDTTAMPGSFAAAVEQGEVIDACEEGAPGERPTQPLDRGERLLRVLLDLKARCKRSGWCSRSQRISCFLLAGQKKQALLIGTGKPALAMT